MTFAAGPRAPPRGPEVPEEGAGLQGHPRVDERFERDRQCVKANPVNVALHVLWTRHGGEPERSTDRAASLRRCSRPLLNRPAQSSDGPELCEMMVEAPEIEAEPESRNAS